MTLPTVAVRFSRADLNPVWSELLANLLTDCVVEEASSVAPEAVNVLVVDNADGHILHEYPNLAFVQSAWAGIDRVLRGGPSIPIARMVAPELTTLMKDYALSLVLAAHRDLPAYRRSQTSGQWRPRPVKASYERSVGILGYGELGREVAAGLAHHGFRVTAWANSPRRDTVEVLSGWQGFVNLLEASEVIVNLLPLNDETMGILDLDAFRLMGVDTTLINLGRGGHVVEEDLLRALNEGMLGDALLDVFEEEPLPPGHPFWQHERITVLPHVAAPSRPADLAVHVAANIDLFLRGQTPRWLVSGGDSFIL